MFGKDFIRRASGLYVPPLIGLAVNPLGRFQPCGEGNCCGSGGVFPCWCFEPWPEEFGVDIAGIVDKVPPRCEVCDALNDTYVIPYYGLFCGASDSWAPSPCPNIGPGSTDIQLLLGATTVRVGFLSGTASFPPPHASEALFEGSWGGGNCGAISGLGVPLTSYVAGECDMSGATCTITAL